MAICKFVVPGPPRGKGVARVTRFGSFTPAKTKAEMEAVKYIALAAMAGRAPFAGPVAMRLCAYVGVPASWSRKNREAALAGTTRPCVKPDFDNICKLVCDGLKRVVWLDDTQVVEAVVWKRYDANPRVVVEVTEIEGVAAP